MNADEVRVDILKKEIDVISQKINHFDNLRLKTRQMAIVLWVAIIGFGLKNSNLQYSGFLYCLASFIPLPFWYIESTYRRYYKGWSSRFKAIRKFIRDGEYVLPNGTKAKYSDFIDSTITDADFPLFDYWAHKTIKKNIRKSKTNLRKSLLNPKIFWIYFPMVLIFLFFALSGFIVYAKKGDTVYIVFTTYYDNGGKRLWVDEVSVLDIEGDIAKIKFEPYPFRGAWFSTRGEANEYVQKMNQERFEENKRKSN